jgi:hypothetical protein
MTPAQLDHLRAIDAHLDVLLALAAKRTPGRWLPGSDTVWAKDEEDERVCNDCGGWDPDFIAACAGRAEAGWRATKASIAAIFNCQANSFPHMYAAIQVEQMADSILAAWPLEILTLP